MERQAKDAIVRQRKEQTAEEKANETAMKKFDSMVMEIKEKWAEEEKKRMALVEERVRAECSVEIKDLKAELATANKFATENQEKLIDVIKKQSDDHHDGLRKFADKSRKTYVRERSHQPSRA